MWLQNTNKSQVGIGWIGWKKSLQKTAAVRSASVQTLYATTVMTCSRCPVPFYCPCPYESLSVPLVSHYFLSSAEGEIKNVIFTSNITSLSTLKQQWYHLSSAGHFFCLAKRFIFLDFARTPCSLPPWSKYLGCTTVSSHDVNSLTIQGKPAWKHVAHALIHNSHS